MHTTSEGSSGSRTSSNPSDLLERNRSSKHASSDTSSVNSGDSSSPRLRRSKLKLIKNLKPDIIKRPSSFIVSENNPSTGTVAGITAKKPDCTLVGYRKMNQDQPTYELGTLSPTSPVGIIGADPASKTSLYATASMPTLLAKSHANLTQSGSMPELSARATYPSNPELMAAMHAAGYSEDLTSDLTLGRDDLRSNILMGERSVRSVPIPNGADPTLGSALSSDSSPSDSSSTNPAHIENGYYSSPSDTNSKSSSSDSSGLKSDQLTGDHEGDVIAGLDYNSLANTLSKALGEPEKHNNSTIPAAVNENDGEEDEEEDKQLILEPGKTDSLLLEYITQFDGSDSGKGDSSFSDAPLSDSTRDRLGSLISGQSLTGGSLATLNGQYLTDSAAKLDGNEYTIFELLKEEMHKSDKITKSSIIGATATDSNDRNKKLESENVTSEGKSKKDKVVSSRAPAGQVPETAITVQPRPSSIVASSSTPEFSSMIREKEQKLVSPVGDHTIK